MSAREDITAHFTSDTLADSLLDAYRAEVLREAAEELRETARNLRNYELDRGYELDLGYGLMEGAELLDPDRGKS